MHVNTGQQNQDANDLMKIKAKTRNNMGLPDKQGGSTTAAKVNTSGRSGSSFRQKVQNMFKPSISKNAYQSSMDSLPLSPQGGASRIVTLSSTN